MSCLSVGIEPVRSVVDISPKMLSKIVATSVSRQGDALISLEHYGSEVGVSYAKKGSYDVKVTCTHSAISITAGLICSVGAGMLEYLECSDEGNLLTLEKEYILVYK